MEYRFSKFRIDPERGLFYRDNELVEAEARILQLLRLLLERYPETVSRRELLDSLWPNQEISDSALAQLVRRTRSLLGDDGQSPIYIKTIHGVGMRFLVAPATAPDAPGEERSFVRWWPLIPSLLIAWLILHFYPAPEEELKDPSRYPSTIALLPFENASGDDTNDWVKYGLMDMVGQLVGAPEGVRVIGTKNVVAYLRNKPVAAALDNPEGMVQAFYDLCGALGCQILLAARLEKTTGNEVLSYQVVSERGVYPLQAVQGESIVAAGAMLAEKVIKRIRPEQPAHVDYKYTYSEDASANLAYAQGLQELINGNPKQAIQYLDIALEKVHDFHWARIPLATAYYRTGNRPKAQEITEELLHIENLNDDLRNRAMHVKALLLRTQGKLSDARSIFQTILNRIADTENRLLAATETMNIGATYIDEGNIELAIPYFEKAENIYQEINYKPGSGLVLANMGLVYSSINEYARAEESLKAAESIFRLLGNEYFLTRVQLQIANIWIATNELQKARQLSNELLPEFERLENIDSARQVALNLARIDLIEGQHDVALKSLLVLLEQAQSEDNQEIIYQTSNMLAIAYLNLHDPESARMYMQPESESEFRSGDPYILLLPAQLAYEEHRFADAVTIAEEAKTAARSAWLPRHEAILLVYREALASGQWKEISLLAN